jgi:hypothetical protein
MVEYASALARCGGVLRSGGALGADSAFETGCDLVDGSKEIYLPFKSFNNNASDLYQVSEDALYLASTIHPVFNKLSRVAKLLVARNMYQILGENLHTPVEFVRRIAK